MRQSFDEQLKRLDSELSLMGAMCEEAIATAAEAVLRGGDEALKKKTAAVTRSLNKRQITETYANKQYDAIRSEREAARDKWLVKWRTAQGL